LICAFAQFAQASHCASHAWPLVMMAMQHALEASMASSAQRYFAHRPSASCTHIQLSCGRRPGPAPSQPRSLGWRTPDKKHGDVRTIHARHSRRRRPLGAPGQLFSPARHGPRRQGNLFTHLTSVCADLDQVFECGSDVQAAGLFHSIYGTGVCALCTCR
jgi:hypothetical protein